MRGGGGGAEASLRGRCIGEMMGPKGGRKEGSQEPHWGLGPCQGVLGEVIHVGLSRDKTAVPLVLPPLLSFPESVTFLESSTC